VRFDGPQNPRSTAAFCTCFFHRRAHCAGCSTIQAEDRRSAQQQSEGAGAVQNDAAMGEALRKQRIQQEAQEAKRQQAAQKAYRAQEADAAKAR